MPGRETDIFGDSGQTDNEAFKTFIREGYGDQEFINEPGSLAAPFLTSHELSGQDENSQISEVSE